MVRSSKGGSSHTASQDDDDDDHDDHTEVASSTGSESSSEPASPPPSSWSASQSSNSHCSHDNEEGEGGSLSSSSSVHSSATSNEAESSSNLSHHTSSNRSDDSVIDDKDEPPPTNMSQHNNNNNDDDDDDDDEEEVELEKNETTTTTTTLADAKPTKAAGIASVVAVATPKAKESATTTTAFPKTTGKVTLPPWLKNGQTKVAPPPPPPPLPQSSSASFQSWTPNSKLPRNISNHKPEVSPGAGTASSVDDDDEKKTQNDDENGDGTQTMILRAVLVFRLDRRRNNDDITTTKINNNNSSSSTHSIPGNNSSHSSVTNRYLPSALTSQTKTDTTIKAVPFSSNTTTATCLAKYDFESSQQWKSSNSSPNKAGGSGSGRNIRSNVTKSYDAVVAPLLVQAADHSSVKNHGTASSTFSSSTSSPISTLKENELIGFRVEISGQHQVVHGSDSEGLCMAVVTTPAYPSSAAMKLLHDLYEDFMGEHDRVGEIQNAKLNAFTFSDKAMMHEVCARYQDPFKIRPRRDGGRVTSTGSKSHGTVEKGPASLMTTMPSRPKVAAPSPPPPSSIIGESEKGKEGGTSKDKDPEWMIARNSLRSISTTRYTAPALQPTDGNQSSSLKSVSFHDSTADRDRSQSRKVETGREEDKTSTSTNKPELTIKRSSLQSTTNRGISGLTHSNPETPSRQVPTASIPTASNVQKEGDGDNSSFSDAKFDDVDDESASSPRSVSEEMESKVSKSVVAKSPLPAKEQETEPEWMKRRAALRPASPQKREIGKEPGSETLAVAKDSLHSAEVSAASEISPKSPYHGLLKKASMQVDADAPDLAADALSRSSSVSGVRFQDEEEDEEKGNDLKATMAAGLSSVPKIEEAECNDEGATTSSRSVDGSAESSGESTVGVSNEDRSITWNPKSLDVNQECWANPARKVDPERVSKVKAEVDFLLLKRLEEESELESFHLSHLESRSIYGKSNNPNFVLEHRRDRGTFQGGGWSLPSTSTKEDVVYRKLVERQSEKDYRYTYITARSTTSSGVDTPGSYWNEVRERHFANQKVPVPTYSGTSIQKQNDKFDYDVDYSMSHTYKAHSTELEEDSWLPPNSANAHRDLVRSMAIGTAAAALAEREKEADSSTVGGISIGALSEVSDWQPPVATRSRRIDFAGGIVPSRGLPSEVRRMKNRQNSVQTSESSVSDGIPWVPPVEYLPNLAEEGADSRLEGEDSTTGVEVVDDESDRDGDDGSSEEEGATDSNNFDDDDDEDDISILITAAVEAKRRSSPPPPPSGRNRDLFLDEELALPRNRSIDSLGSVVSSYTGRISFNIEPQLITFQDDPDEDRGTHYGGTMEKALKKREEKTARTIGRDTTHFRWFRYFLVVAVFIAIPVLAFVLVFVVFDLA